MSRSASSQADTVLRPPSHSGSAPPQREADLASREDPGRRHPAAGRGPQSVSKGSDPWRRPICRHPGEIGRAPDSQIILPPDPCASDPRPERAARVVRVLTGLLSAPIDVHSVHELCRVAPVGVAPATFRRWCQQEAIQARHALDFARLLRALMLARRQRTSMSEWIDVDPRTLRRLLDRAGIARLFQRQVPEFSEFLEGQHLVRNSIVLRLVRGVWQNHVLCHRKHR